MAKGSAAAEKMDPGGRFNSKLFKEKVGQLDAKKKIMDSARADMSNIWKAVEDHGGNRAAMKLALKIRDMPADTRNDFLAYLETYCNWLGVFAQGDLFGTHPGVPRAPAAAATEGEQPPPIEGEEEEGHAEGEQDADGLADDVEVVTVEQLDAAEQEGYDASKAGRDPRWSAFPEGSVLRTSYDRGFAKHQRELAEGQGGSPAAPKGRGRPRGAAKGAAPKVSRGAKTTGRGRQKANGAQPAAAE